MHNRLFSPSILFVALLGDVDNTAVVTLRAQQDIVNSGTGMATLSGSAACTAAATDADDKALVLDIHQPKERYVRPQIVRATANLIVDGA